MLTCVKHIYGFDNQLPCQSCWPSEVFDPKSASAWLVSGVNVTPNGQSVTELFFHQPLIRSTRSCDARPLFASNAGIVWELLNCSWHTGPGVLCGGETQECSIVRNALREFESAPTSDVFVCLLLVSVATQICFRNNIFSCSWTCQCRSIFFK